MIKVADYLGLMRVKGDIGVEIEIEGDNLPHKATGWKVVEDGSLRGESAEYVLKNPVAIEDLNKMFKSLRKAFEEAESEIHESHRAGTHVHINVQDYTFVELYNFITVFILLEEGLLNLCPSSRRGNHFCLRTKDAGYSLDRLWKAAELADVNKLNTEDIRYSAMNITSVFRHGSVEFRFLQSTEDFDTIKDWCKLFYHLGEFAKTFSDPQKIVGQISFDGFETFCEKALGPYFAKFSAHPDWKATVKRGVRSAQDIAYSRDWAKVSLDIFDKKQGIM